MNILAHIVSHSSCTGTKALLWFARFVASLQVDLIQRCYCDIPTSFDVSIGPSPLTAQPLPCFVGLQSSSTPCLIGWKMFTKPIKCIFSVTAPSVCWTIRGFCKLLTLWLLLINIQNLPVQLQLSPLSLADNHLWVWSSGTVQILHIACNAYHQLIDICVCYGCCCYAEPWAADHEEAEPWQHCDAEIFLLFKWRQGDIDWSHCSHTVFDSDQLLPSVGCILWLREFCSFSIYFFVL